MSGEEQREFGRLVIGAFLETTLRGSNAYRQLFIDHRSAGDWLPPTMYSTRYADSRERTLASFEEDIDLTTGTLPGVTLRGDSLTTWREFDLPFRTANNTMRSTALRLGWNNNPVGPDTTTPRWPARFTIALSDSLRRTLQPDANSAITLSLFVTDQTPGPRKTARDSSKAADSAKPATPPARPPARPSAKPPAKDTTPPDLTVEMVDSNGRTARIALSEFGPVRRPIESYVYRRAGRDAQRFTARYEQVLHTYVMPLRPFEQATPGFDPRALAEVRLVFDKTRVGQVHIDDIGITRLP